MQLDVGDGEVVTGGEVVTTLVVVGGAVVVALGIVVSGIVVSGSVVSGIVVGGSVCALAMATKNTTKIRIINFPILCLLKLSKPATRCGPKNK